MSKKALNDFGGFDRKVAHQWYRFWPRADGGPSKKERVVEAAGESWFDAREEATRLLAERGIYDVAAQDLECMACQPPQLNGKAPK